MVLESKQEDLRSKVRDNFLIKSLTLPWVISKGQARISLFGRIGERGPMSLEGSSIFIIPPLKYGVSHHQILGYQLKFNPTKNKLL